MTVALPPLMFTPGAVFCLHLPQNGAVEGLAVERAVEALAARSGLEAVVCHPASPPPGRWWRVRPTRSVGWLSRAAGIDALRAERGVFGLPDVGWLSRAAGIDAGRAMAMIADLGVRVERDLGRNAGTPRALLGIAAAACREPAVLVYTTAALDPAGKRAVHRYVGGLARGLCAVHVSSPTWHGDGSPAPRMCPESACCVEVDPAVPGVDPTR